MNRVKFLVASGISSLSGVVFSRPHCGGDAAFRASPERPTNTLLHNARATPIQRASNPAPDLTDFGIVVTAGAVLLTARLILEQTWISFRQGVIAPDSWPVLGIAGGAAFGAAILWMIAVGIARNVYGREIDRLDRRLVGAVLVCVLLCAVPGERWRLMTAHVGGAQGAPREWMVDSAARGDTRLLDYLLSHGANPNARLSNGQTALGAAAAAGQLAACDLLIAKGAHLNGRTARTGETALLEAAEEDRVDVVRLLIVRGADSSARDAAGLSAEDWAVVNRDRNLQELVRRH